MIIESDRLPTKEYLLECFSYEDGELYWKERPRHHFRFEWNCKQANDNFAGKIAGSAVSNGYFAVKINKKMFLIHRIIAKIFNINTDNEIDHIDGNRSNNKFENLRQATKNQNQHNKTINKNSTSGIKGLMVRKKHGIMFYRCMVKANKVTYEKHFRCNEKNFQLAKNWLIEKRAELHKAYTNNGT